MDIIKCGMENWLNSEGLVPEENVELGMIWLKILIYPDSPYFSDYATSPEAKAFIDEAGGAIWFCDGCGCISSPNRSCDCASVRQYTLDLLDAHAQR